LFSIQNQHFDVSYDRNKKYFCIQVNIIAKRIKLKMGCGCIVLMNAETNTTFFQILQQDHLLSEREKIEIIKEKVIRKTKKRKEMVSKLKKIVL
jgi:hypothetical protein